LHHAAHQLRANGDGLPVRWASPAGTSPPRWTAGAANWGSYPVGLSVRAAAGRDDPNDGVSSSRFSPPATTTSLASRHAAFNGSLRLGCSIRLRARSRRRARRQASPGGSTNSLNFMFPTPSRLSASHLSYQPSFAAQREPASGDAQVCRPGRSGEKNAQATVAHPSHLSRAAASVPSVAARQ
jgi:hypothetical protein